MATFLPDSTAGIAACCTEVGACTSVSCSLPCEENIHVLSGHPAGRAPVHACQMRRQTHNNAVVDVQVEKTRARRDFLGWSRLSACNGLCSKQLSFGISGRLPNCSSTGRPFKLNCMVPSLSKTGHWTPARAARCCQNAAACHQDPLQHMSGYMPLAQCQPNQSHK